MEELIKTVSLSGCAIVQNTVEQSLVPTDEVVTLSLSDINVPVYDNPTQSDVFLNTGSPSNNDIFDTYEDANIVPIPPGSGSVFPDDPNLLPNTETLTELLKNLSEVMIRFNTNPGYYQIDDYRVLINTITNALIHLYLKEGETTLSGGVSFIGVATLLTDPIVDMNNLNNLFPGVYFAQESGFYSNFNITITPDELVNNIVILSPILSNGTYISYKKDIYTLNITLPESDKYYRHEQNIPTTIWNINHNLNKRPSVITTTTRGTIVEGEVNYIDNNNIIINFSAAFTGYAELN